MTLSVVCQRRRMPSLGRKKRCDAIDHRHRRDIVIAILMREPATAENAGRSIGDT